MFMSVFEMFYPPCERCSNLELVCGQSTKAAGKGKADKCERCRVKKVVCKRLPKLVTEDEREVRRKVWTDPKTGETSVYPYTAVESPPQSTPNDKELIELEQETAAPWVTGKKAINQVSSDTGPSDLSVHSPRFALLQAARRGKSKRTREQLEEDEILQEVLEEEAAIARLTEAAKNQELVAGQASEFDSLSARHQIRKKIRQRSEEKDRLFNWSSDDEEEIDVLRKPKEEMKSKVISIGEETAKAVAKLMKMIPKGLKEEAKIVRRDLAEAVEGKIKDANKFLEKEF
ncbi:hypothetical protein H4Q26_013529 [Puccinia striiformis f. sp. tritici PST-130]|nr:hypothetical protein H4Q26_013529 [Puccinia striiformis f. sp. tritici PST-130]